MTRHYIYIYFFILQCAVKLQKIMQEKVQELLEFDQVNERYYKVSKPYYIPVPILSKSITIIHISLLLYENVDIRFIQVIIYASVLIFFIKFLFYVRYICRIRIQIANLKTVRNSQSLLNEHLIF